MTEYIYSSIDEINSMIIELWNKVENSGFKPDCIVGISRGGLFPARILSDVSGINDVYVVGVRYYSDIGVTEKKPKVIQDIDKKYLEDKNVLLIDDVSDSGKSLKFTVDFLKGKGVKELKVATLHIKPGAVFMPDYYIGKTSKWIVYAWEPNEVIKKIIESDMSLEEKKNELSKTGIPREIIKRFTDI